MAERKKRTFHSLRNVTFLDWSKFKALTGNKISVTEKLKFDLGKHCGKRRKCCLPAFSPFLAMFSNGIFLTLSQTTNFRLFPN